MKIEIHGEEIDVEIADTVLKRGIGLSLRKKGRMLFRFPEETRAPVDMMLMRRSLFLYFMNQEGEVIHVEKADPWIRFPEKFFHRPETSYRYLLESFKDLGLEEGDQVSF